jgi:4-amino-4-deoxy-L-arabinose transferase-like glycosyltransferase
LPKIPRWVFLLIALLHLSAARVDIMDIDAAQYAEISREMMLSGDYLHVYDRGANYLDKPPFLFWVSSLSMRVFGVNNFGYRFPSILFLFLAVYATYRLCRRLYGEATGRMAALILFVCQGAFLMTNDVRTDTILMAWVITAVWCIKECEIKRRWPFVLGGTLAIACGMMTKGPIALFVPLFCFGTDWLLKRKWRQLFSPWHLADAALIALFLIPMSIGLYQQYDLHPEKWIDGQQGTSGLRFFYWTQSFGRITGESSWDNGADISFLLVSMLWAFLPWMFLFLGALILNVKELVRQRLRLRDDQEWITTGGFILSYLALGMSHYQLPHYIFVVFPLAAIMVAKLLQDFFAGNRYPRLCRFYKGTQTVSTALLLIGLLLILTIVFPAGITGIVLWGLTAGIWLLLVLRKGLPARMFWVSAVTMVLINIFLTHHFYYRLLQYQAGSQVGRYVRQQRIPQERLVAYRMRDPLSGMHFYAQQVIRMADGPYLPAGPGDYVLTMDEGLAAIRGDQRPYELVKSGQLFKVSELTPDFLNRKTRHKALRNYYLIRLR